MSLVSSAAVPREDNKAVKLPPDLHRKVKFIAMCRGENMTEYLSALIRQAVERDYQREFKKFREQPPDESDD